MPVVLRVLGSRELVGADGRVLHTVLAQPKRFALLALLAADRRAAMHRRDALVALFWPELPEEKARNALSQALSFLRRALGETAVVSRGVEEVGVDRTLVTCDAVMLEEAAARGEHERVLELYRGDLLPGLRVDDAPAFEQWLEGERRYLRDRTVAATKALQLRRTGTGAFADAVSFAERAVMLAPHDEPVVIDLVRLHQRLGNQAAALRVYDDFVRRLDADLELRPSPMLEALGAELRAASLERTPARVSSTAHPTTSTAPVPESEPAGGEAIAVVPTGVSAPFTAGFPGRRRLAWGAVAAVLAVAWVIAAVKWAAASARTVPRVRFALALDDSARILPDANGVSLALSPDGTEVAYVGGVGVSRIYRRRFDELAARPVPGTDNARNVAFSPDGKWLTFTMNQVLRRMPVAGGPMVTIADSVQRYSWGEGGVIVFDRPQIHASRSLWRIRSDGGSPELLSRVDSAHGETVRTWPDVLPGGGAALFEIQSGGVRTSELAVIRFSDRRVTRLGIRGQNPRYVAGGFIVFGRFGGTAFAVPFDAARLRVTGPEAPVLEDVVVKEGGETQIATAPNGTLVYGRATSARQLLIVDQQGRGQPAVADLRGYLQPRLSPDGTRIAVVIDDRDSKDVWIADVASGALTRLTTSGRADRPEWAADGHLIFWRESNGTDSRIRSQAPDGSGTPATFAESTQTILASPTGRFYAAIPTRYGPPRVGIDLIDTLVPRSRAPLVDATDGPVMGRISPDGRWLAFATGLAGQRELFVQAIGGAKTRHRISGAGSSDPVWGSTSHELLYRSAGKFVRATLSLAPDLVVTRRDTLFDDVFWRTDNSRFADYDATRDGKRIAAVKVPGEQVRLTVVVGWSDELRDRFGARR